MNTGKMRIDDSNRLGAAVLLVATEMGRKRWRLAMGPEGASKHRQVTVDAGQYLQVEQAVQQARERFSLPKDCRVIFCYEAGREGFHPYRVWSAAGHTVWVVDSGSIEVNRRRRRAKNDTLDAGQLWGLMQRQQRGEQRALRVVRVPTVPQEDERQRTRERQELIVERGRLRTRMQSLVLTQGWRDFPNSVRKIQGWLAQHAQSLGEHLHARLQRELERLSIVDRQLKALDRWQLGCCRERQGSSVTERTGQRLYQLKGIGERSACVLAAELFGWRGFHNRREVGALVGLTPTPYDSGDSRREQGISKAGNKRVRHTIIEVAWKWLDYQPGSALSGWYRERFGHGGRRARRIGIVALARKLLIALWRYLEQGLLPQGAQLKA